MNWKNCIEPWNPFLLPFWHSPSRPSEGHACLLCFYGKMSLSGLDSFDEGQPVGRLRAHLREQVRGKSQSVDTVALALEVRGARSGEQSGDLQGLSNVQGADSESVDELLEEGNALEADVVKGVQDAGDADEGEVRTHEVPQDDVPGEYRDK